jgi:hypothetical protein
MVRVYVPPARWQTSNQSRDMHCRLAGGKSRFRTGSEILHNCERGATNHLAPQFKLQTYACNRPTVAFEPIVVNGVRTRAISEAHRTIGRTCRIDMSFPGGLQSRRPRLSRACQTVRCDVPPIPILKNLYRETNSCTIQLALWRAITSPGRRKTRLSPDAKFWKVRSIL